MKKNESEKKQTKPSMKHKEQFAVRKIIERSQIMQSFSHGKSEKASMKLHSLVIGPPGVGKKLLTMTAKILNPVSEEISSTDGKITLAGLVGSAGKAKGGNIDSKLSAKGGDSINSGIKISMRYLNRCRLITNQVPHIIHYFGSTKVWESDVNEWPDTPIFWQYAYNLIFLPNDRLTKSDITKLKKRPHPHTPLKKTRLFGVSQSNTVEKQEKK